MTRPSFASRLTIRSLRAWLLAVACTVALVAAGTATAAEPAQVTHGPILGGLASTGIRIWARTSRPAPLRVRYGRSADRLESLSPAVETDLAHDNTGVVALDGLQPGTRYHYRTLAGDLPGPGGTFRTLPDPAALADPKLNPRGLFNFKFEFACGNNQNPKAGLGPSLPTYDTLLAQVADEVDFAILNGDWLYEEARDYPASAWRQQVGLQREAPPRVVQVAPTIAGVWQNYKLYLERGQNLSKWHRRVPTFFTLDDHELVNDVIACGAPGFRNRRTVFRDIAVQGWFDYLGWSNPQAHAAPAWFGRGTFRARSDVLVDRAADFTRLPLDRMASLHVHWGTPDAGVMDVPAGDVEGGDPNAGVYRIVEVLGPQRLRIDPPARATGAANYSIGRRTYGRFRVANCDFFLLDTRSHRGLHDLKRPDLPGLSMLGDHQREWLLREMAASDAEFTFVVSSVNFMIPHVGGGGHRFDAATKDDAWTVFLDEREKLIESWERLGKPVFVLTGDLHNSFAVKISDTIWEFASGPHNSVNHRAEDEGNRPVSGRFMYGPRPCDIRWSTTALADIPRPHRMFPHYCVVQVNNVFNNPLERGGTRRVAYPHPQVIFRFHDGLTGELKYAEAIGTPRKASGGDAAAAPRKKVGE